MEENVLKLSVRDTVNQKGQMAPSSGRIVVTAVLLAMRVKYK